MTGTCGAVDPLSGAVCSGEAHDGDRHADHHDPALIVWWADGDQRPWQWCPRCRTLSSEPVCGACLTTTVMR